MNQRLEALIEQYTRAFQAARVNCAEAVLSILCEYYGVGDNVYPRIATAFGGGVAGTQNICGALTGGMMAIGLRLGRDVGGDKAPSYEAGRELLAWANERQGCIACREITGVDLNNPIEQSAFRAPGGRHETVCAPLVGEVCRYLAARLD